MKAARKIKASNKLSTRGKHNSMKMHRMIPWESTLERDFIKLLDFDPTVTHFEFQPIRIDYVFLGRKKKYFPDFLVIKDDLQKYIYEVKAANKVEDETNKIKFQVGRKYCTQNNMKYVVVSEPDIRKGYLIENLDTLSEARPETTSRKVMNKILLTLDELGGKTTIGNIKKSLQSIDQGELENNIYYLIYSHEVGADLESKLINDDQTFIRRK